MLSCWSVVAGQHDDIAVIRAQIEQSVQCIRSSGLRPNQLLPYKAFRRSLGFSAFFPSSFKYPLCLQSYCSQFLFLTTKKSTQVCWAFHPSNQSATSETCWWRTSQHVLPPECCGRYLSPACSLWLAVNSIIGHPVDFYQHQFYILTKS